MYTNSTAAGFYTVLTFITRLTCLIPQKHVQKSIITSSLPILLIFIIYILIGFINVVSNFSSQCCNNSCVKFVYTNSIAAGFLQSFDIYYFVYIFNTSKTRTIKYYHNFTTFSTPSGIRHQSLGFNFLTALSHLFTPLSYLTITSDLYYNVFIFYFEVLSVLKL